ncbi:MAG TPA: hypothetical protein VFB43_08415 [Terracidiphilus sp.]|nr:hypothetical protein [Terracidiphilus sp.]
MNTGSTEALPKEAQSAGASFFEVLAGTSSALPIALPGDAVAPASSSAGQQGDSESSAQGDQSSSANASDSTSNQNSVPANVTQVPVALASQNSLLALVQSTPSQPQTVRSTASTTNANGHTADHAQKAQPSAQQSDANVQSLADLASLQQIAVPPVPVPAVPSPEVSTPAPDSTTAQSSQPIAATASAAAPVTAQQAVHALNQPPVVQQPAVELQAAVAQPVDTNGQDNLQAPAAKADDKAPAENAKDSAQSANAAAKPANSDSQQASNSANATAPASASAAAILQTVPVLPGINLVPDAGDLNQAPSKTAQNGKAADDSSIDFSKIPDALSGVDAKKISTAQSTATSAASSNAITGSSQGSQRTQSDASQTSTSGQKNQEGGAQATASQFAAQIQTIANHDAGHDAPASHVHADGIADAVRTASQQADGLNTPTAAINTANVIQKMSETEMHVGMRSADFGEVSIRTLVSQQQMTAQISVDHSDLGKAISAHIPAMEAKIGGDLGVRALVEVNQSGMSFSGERGFSSQREQRSFTQPAQNQNASVSAEADQPVARMAAAALSTDNGYRLDIRA